MACRLTCRLTCRCRLDRPSPRWASANNPISPSPCCRPGLSSRMPPASLLSVITVAQIDRHVASSAPAPHEASVLLGTFLRRRKALATFPSSPAASSPSDLCLFFADRTGCIPCVFLRFDAAWLDQTVVLARWSLSVHRPASSLSAATEPTAAAAVAADSAAIGDDRDSGSAANALPSGTSVGSDRSDLAAPAFGYLRISAILAPVAATHPIMKLPTYTLSDADLDIHRELGSQRRQRCQESLRLLRQHSPVTMLLNSPTQPEDGKLRALQALESQRRVSIHGRIHAKSGLIVADNQIQFYVELRCMEASNDSSTATHQAESSSPMMDMLHEAFQSSVLTAFVLVVDTVGSAQDTSVPYYDSLQVGDVVLFTGLKIRSLRSESESKSILMFDLGASKMFKLEGITLAGLCTDDGQDPSERPNTASETATVPQLSESRRQAQQNKVRDEHRDEEQDEHRDEEQDERCFRHIAAALTAPFQSSRDVANRDFRTMHVSFVGRITRVINHLYGIYEIDGRYTLYLTLMSSRSCGAGLTANVELALHHLHLIVHTPADAPAVSSGDQRGSTQRIVSLFPCLHSSIDILRFPSDDACAATDHIASHETRERLRSRFKHMNAIDLLNYLDLQRCLHESVQLDEAALHKSILSIMGHFGHSPYRPPKAIEYFIHGHEEACTFAEQRYRRPALVTVSTMCRLPAVRKAQTQLDLYSPIHTFTAAELFAGRPNVLLVGTLALSPDGGLQLIDANMRLDVFVERARPDECSPPWRLLDRGTVVGLSKFKLIIEALGASEDFQNRSTILKTYLSASWTDALILRRPKGPDIPSMLPNHPGQQLIRVDHIGPVASRESQNGQTFSAYMQAVMWYVKRSTATDNTCSIEPLTRPHRVLAQISEREHLSALAGLQVGGLYLCLGLVPIREDDGSDHEQPDYSTYACTALDDEVYMRATNSFALQQVLVDGQAMPPDLDPKNPSILRARLESSNPNWSVSESPFDDATGPTLHSIASLIRHCSGMRDAGFGQFYARLLDVTGVIESKTVCPAPSTSRHGYQEGAAIAGHGLGRAGRVLVVGLVSHQSRERIDVHFDLRRLAHPIGLIPGMQVVLRRLALKRNRAGELFGVSIADTRLEIYSPGQGLLPFVNSRGADETRASSAPSWFLADFFDAGLSDSHRMSTQTVSCTITFLCEASFWCQCSRCGQIVTHHGCTPRCKTIRKFMAQAKCLAHDSTFEATLGFDSVETVSQLLLLDSRHIQQLEDTVAEYGKALFEDTPPWYEQHHDRTKDGGDSAGRDFGPPDPDEYGSSQIDPSNSFESPSNKLLYTLCHRARLPRVAKIQCRNVFARSNRLKSGWRQGGVDAAGSTASRIAAVHHRASEATGATPFQILVQPEYLRQRRFKNKDGDSVSTLSMPRLFLKVTELESVPTQLELRALLDRLAKLSLFSGPSGRTKEAAANDPQMQAQAGAG
ncbi:uncharacterized protein BJ171DRAFT_514749 [Polychytrium aggregatum]|uniref:uncharacterized protein n=1 Tax=Polychytrium aggregatum TaxID=110093 RepID=UPI0022FDC1A5|nr:uncharacterized protein BJ171DRAFT_514749 [Polychytrium aggregatum]KAI9202347.1 hypothetical protein BJ171DRAFT_514749 [Polychytrium aggregatum]